MRELNFPCFSLNYPPNKEEKNTPIKKAKNSFTTDPKYVRPTSIALSSASSSVYKDLISILLPFLFVDTMAKYSIESQL